MHSNAYTYIPHTGIPTMAVEDVELQEPLYLVYNKSTMQCGVT